MALAIKSSVVAALKLCVFLIVITLFITPIWLCDTLRLHGTKALLLRSFYRIASWGWRIKVTTHGVIPSAGPLLVVSNHCSYLDIPVIGQLLSVRFTPKADVRNWPLIGYLSHLASCVFIDRRRTETKRNQTKIAQQLKHGAIISLFPEGTTNDGSSVKKFRSSYFSLATTDTAHTPAPVQPVTVLYTHHDGTALSREDMDKVAWYGEAEFVGHLWEYFKTDGVHAHLVFHEPVTINNFIDRKALTQHCWQLIAEQYVTLKKKAPRRALSNNGG